ncbi:hypothetical protein AGMMS50212_15180 [Spirochaetia bacterium]|nr:hypothetical protein AGMMS50212_15180 [Spirochaetia bacterium]
MFHYIIILLFIALTILIYDFHFPPDFSLPHTGKNIIAHIVFFFASLGSSLSFHVAGIFEAIIFLIVGLMIFVVTILICIYLIRHKRLQENVFPALLVIFGFIFCIVLTIDHGQESAWVALASHYTIFTMFIIIGLIMIIYTEFIKDGRSGRIKQIAVNGLKLIAFIVLLQNTDVLKLKYIRDDKLELQHIIRTYEDRDLIELQKSGPWDDLESAYNQIHIIERRHWNVFR